MRAVILAAGRGRRLGSPHGTPQQPKCLLEFEGKSLLSRHLNLLDSVHISDVTIVTGYCAQSISRAIDGQPFSGSIQQIDNPDFEKGSVLSLFTARDALASGDDVLVMDADVLYDKRMLQRLLKSPHKNCFLMDRGFEPGEEPVKVCASAGNVIEFSKLPSPEVDCDTIGESVGFIKLSGSCAQRIAQQCTQFVNDGRINEPHEEVIREVVCNGDQVFGCEDITDLPWIEIDFPDDIERAQQQILPRLQ